MVSLVKQGRKGKKSPSTPLRMKKGRIQKKNKAKVKSKKEKVKI